MTTAKTAKTGLLTVVVVDDQARFRSALTTVVELTDGLELGGSFASVAELRTALSEPRAQTWDVILMDLEMPRESGIDGLDLVKRQRPDVRVVMCTVYDDGDAVQEAVQHGADGYLLKSAPLPVLLERLRSVATGGAPLAPEVARGLLDQLRRPEPDASVAPSWEVAADGTWATTAAGERLDLKRRRAARRILAALARNRVESPGAPLSAEACIQAGWPGERMSWTSAQARMWTAIRTLRSIGLEPVLETTSEGYRLAMEVVIRPC